MLFYTAVHGQILVWGCVSQNQESAMDTKEWLCLKMPHLLAASFLWSVPLHTLQNPSPMKTTSLASSRPPTPSSEPGTASGSQRRELARTTLSFQRCRCSFDAQQPTSSFLRPLVPEPSSSPQHGHLLLHLLFACPLSLRQTCQQSSQPGAGSICQ